MPKSGHVGLLQNVKFCWVWALKYIFFNLTIYQWEAGGFFFNSSLESGRKKRKIKTPVQLLTVSKITMSVIFFLSETFAPVVHKQASQLQAFVVLFVYFLAFRSNCTIRRFSAARWWAVAAKAGSRGRQPCSRLPPRCLHNRPFTP